MLTATKPFWEYYRRIFHQRGLSCRLRTQSGLLQLLQYLLVRQMQTIACFVSSIALSKCKELMSIDVDAPIRLSEEAQDAAVAVPRAAMRSQLISGFCGLLVRFQPKHTS